MLTHAYGGIWFPNIHLMLTYALCGLDFPWDRREWTNAPTCPACRSKLGLPES